MTVAIHHNHITGRNRMMPHHFIAGAGAIGYEKTMIGVENSRRVALGCADCAVVIQQLAQFLDRVANIGTQHVFTVKLVIHLPDGGFQKRHAAGMAGAVPRIGSVLGVIQQRLEKRRLDRFEV